MTAGGRPYRSALREEQSRATRRRIIDAGAALFVESGYVPTTIDAIAERAGVSRRTVFTSVGDRKSTRLNSSHANISYAVFCLKKKKLQHINRNYRLYYT